MSLELKKLLEPTLNDKGYLLVSLKILKVGNKTLQIIIKRMDGKGVSLLDCQNASKAISLILEVEDKIRGSYSLEVSSPGIS